MIVIIKYLRKSEMFLEFQVGGPSSQAFLFHLGLCILRRPHPGGSSSAPMSICRKTRAPVQWGCCSSPRNPLQRAGGHRSWIKSYQNLVINYFSGLIFCGFIGFLRTSKSRISTTDSNTQRVLSCCRKQQGKRWASAKSVSSALCKHQATAARNGIKLQHAMFDGLRA